MIETPAAAVMSAEFAKQVDFFSIGTNDLTQYTLAADRMNPKLQSLYAQEDDAVLRLIAFSAKNAADHGIWCGICGDLATHASSAVAALLRHPGIIRSSAIRRLGKSSSSIYCNSQQDIAFRPFPAAMFQG